MSEEFIKMATYVCSDIHGRQDRYMKLLKEIGFCDSDKMYILGDVIDRNPDGLEILLDVLDRPNINMMLGNHELFMIDTIVKNYTDYVDINEDWFNSWTYTGNGGMGTFDKYIHLSLKTRECILEKLKNSLVIKVLEVNGQKFHLSHASTLKGFTEGELHYSDVSHDELMHIVWNSVFRRDKRHDDISNYDEDITYIVGHVPVQRQYVDKILVYGNIIDIDCGSAYRSLESNSLGCLRLDDMKEFYVE